MQLIVFIVQDAAADILPEQDRIYYGGATFLITFSSDKIRIGIICIEGQSGDCITGLTWRS